MVSGEAVEMYLRFSVVLTYANNQWKVLHWHGSKPENVQSDSDTFGIENWKQKAEALEKLVAVRTADLRTKNRELEIETALEKVRAIAMGMKVPTDMLAVCETISQQMEALGVKEIRNVQTAIFYPAKGTYTNYEYYQKHQKALLTETTYSNNEKHAAFADDMQKGAGQFFELNLSGDEVKEWLTYQKTTNVFIDDFLYQASSLIYYWCSLGPVALGLSTYEPLEENGKELFKRFSNVFDLAYRRYLDIEKAEAQAREAGIELALERVRARTMAMQHSDELAEISLLLDSQVRSLGIKTRGCAFNIYGEHESTEWFSSEAGTFPTYKTPRENIFLSYYEAGRRGETLLIKEFPDEVCATHYEYLCTVPVMGDVLKKVKESGLLPVHQIDHVTYFKYGYLLFITFEPAPEAHDIFKRFANVFEQTYTRFLDLQKAEAQTREAQIETALERVRSRTLAMQKSDELAETSTVLFKQLILLGISPNRLYISIIKSDEGDTEFWITDEDGSKVSMAFEDKLNGNPTFKKMFAGWKQQNKSLVIAMEGEELEQYLQHLRSINIPFKGGLAQKRRWQYIAYFNKGFIGMASPDEQPKETVHLLERFASAFNLTFTRFTDLKIAEAHAAQAEEDLIKLQTEKLRAENALAELQATQKQLVQSEKMASLGELTAGIAHEIQNPLNFVNNFSEVSKELLVELKEEADKGNMEEVKAIAADIIDNEKKFSIMVNEPMPL